MIRHPLTPIIESKCCGHLMRSASLPPHAQGGDYATAPVPARETQTLPNLLFWVMLQHSDPEWGVNIAWGIGPVLWQPDAHMACPTAFSDASGHIGVMASSTMGTAPTTSELYEGILWHSMGTWRKGGQPPSAPIISGCGLWTVSHGTMYGLFLPAACVSRLPKAEFN